MASITLTRGPLTGQTASRVELTVKKWFVLPQLRLTTSLGDRRQSRRVRNSSCPVTFHATQKLKAWGPHRIGRHSRYSVETQ